MTTKPSRMELMDENKKIYIYIHEFCTVNQQHESFKVLCVYRDKSYMFDLLYTCPLTQVYTPLSERCRPNQYCPLSPGCSRLRR